MKKKILVTGASGFIGKSFVLYNSENYKCIQVKEKYSFNSFKAWYSNNFINVRMPINELSKLIGSQKGYFTTWINHLYPRKMSRGAQLSRQWQD